MSPRPCCVPGEMYCDSCEEDPPTLRIPPTQKVLPPIANPPRRPAIRSMKDNTIIGSSLYIERRQLTFPPKPKEVTYAWDDIISSLPLSMEQG